MNMYVCIGMHLVQKGGESTEFHQVLVGTMHLVQKGGESTTGEQSIIEIYTSKLCITNLHSAPCIARTIAS
eukprot:COSAG02_NODE_29221_length_573_cov_3.801688_1_plen_71_part_00